MEVPRHRDSQLSRLVGRALVCFRGGRWLPFFCLSLLFLPNSIAAQELSKAITVSRALGLAETEVWSVLLHHKDGKCYAAHESFMMEPAKCDLQVELEGLLVKLLSADSQSSVEYACRFPARVAYLKKVLSPHGVFLPEPNCKEFAEYLNRAPAEQISLVFAAENVRHPMSMMGHVFIKLSGLNAERIPVDHAASFFTKIDSSNPLKLIADSMFLGMESFFSLRPYAQVLHSYRNGEKRNVWEYQLELTPEQKRLIHYHIWELKSVKAPYYFIGYNCATAVYFTLALGESSVIEKLGLWVDPMTVARRFSASNKVARRVFLPSIDWRVRTLTGQLGSQVSEDIYTSLLRGVYEPPKKPATEEAILSAHLAEALVDFHQAFPAQLELGKASAGGAWYDELKATTQAHPLESDSLSDPIAGPRSSRIVVGGVHQNGARYGKLELLPASHYLSDDNRRSYMESRLGLGKVSVLYGLDDSDVRLQELALYSYDALIPHNKFTGGLSSRAFIGATQQWSDSLKPYTATQIELGIGRTYSVTTDVRTYAMLSGAVSAGAKGGKISYFPEVGFTMYEIFNMKTIGAFRLVCGEDRPGRCYRHTSLTQSLFLTENFTPYFSLDHRLASKTESQVYEVGLRYAF